MKIYLDANFKLLGSHNIDNIELNRSDITLKEFLHIMSDRSTKSPEYLNSDQTDVDGLFQVYVNGQMLSLCKDGVNTVLKDRDAVAICTNVLEGCCGGSLQGIN